MKYLVTYFSLTGNTKRVAEAIYDALPAEKTIKPFNEVDTLEGVDLAFVGFPVMQFGPPAAARKFLGEHATGRRIALFITHAMLTGSDDPRQQAMLSNELEKCRSACAKSDLAGLFHCQGELSETMADELRESGIPALMAFAGMRPATLGHPFPEEIASAGKFAIEMIAGR